MTFIKAISLNPWAVKTNAYTAVNLDRLNLNTTANGTFAVAFPAPVVGGNIRTRWAGGTVAPTLTGVDPASPSFGTVGDVLSFESDGASWFIGN